jgi:hypothetical protein
VSGTVYLCGGDAEECPRHGRFLYFCSPCHDEWKAANPLTTAAIGEYARGKGTVAAVNAAKAKDRAARAGSS